MDASRADPGYRGARVLVLGATGFIGRHVALALERAGADLHVAVRARRPGLAGRVHRFDAAADDPRALVRALHPAVTFNLAGYGVDPAERDEERARSINEAFAGRLAAALAEAFDPAWPGQALVHAGTAAEYGAVRGDLDERTRPEPATLYGRTKVAGTLAIAAQAQERGLAALTARLFTVYGPGERAGRLLPSLIEAARRNAELPLTSGRQKRDFTYVEDAAQGLLRLGRVPRGKAEPGEPVNLATGRLTEVRDFARAAAALLGMPPERLRFGELPAREGEMEHDPVRVERLRALTGWIPATGIEQGIRLTIAAAGER